MLVPFRLLQLFKYHICILLHIPTFPFFSEYFEKSPQFCHWICCFATLHTMMQCCSFKCEQYLFYASTLEKLDLSCSPSVSLPSRQVVFVPQLWTMCLDLNKSLGGISSSKLPQCWQPSGTFPRDDSNHFTPLPQILQWRPLSQSRRQQLMIS